MISSGVWCVNSYRGVPTFQRILLLDSTQRRYVATVRLKCDSTWWRTGEEVKGKLANGVGSQYSSHYPALQPLMRTPRLHVVDWTDAPADLNGLVRFAERRNLVSARVPSHFKSSLPHDTASHSNQKQRPYSPMWGPQAPLPTSMAGQPKHQRLNPGSAESMVCHSREFSEHPHLLLRG